LRPGDSWAVGEILVYSKDQLELTMFDYLLKQHGQVVRLVRNLEAAVDAVKSSVVDLAMVDGGRSRADGEAACRMLRRVEPDLPIILLSEISDDDATVAGLEYADRYIVKPTSPRQLLANVDTMLRRLRASRSNGQHQDSLVVGAVTLSLAGCNVWINGRSITVTPREFSLLQALMENANRVLSREQLISIAWGENYAVVSKTVDVYVQRLRQKLDSHGGPYIQSSRGFGYRFRGGVAGLVVSIGLILAILHASPAEFHVLPGLVFTNLLPSASSPTPSSTPPGNGKAPNQWIAVPTRPAEAKPTPTGSPSVLPSHSPSPTPADSPSPSRTDTPSPLPTDSQSSSLTDSPSPSPTESPSPSPTESPSPSPTESPSPSPTESPSPSPADSPSPSPTDSPSPSPTRPAETRRFTRSAEGGTQGTCRARRRASSLQHCSFGFPSTGGWQGKGGLST
jgi:DNA-binding response OmpR family regulator/outer membrane biosynthesis protein TonB